jgi:hypothetical protein
VIKVQEHEMDGASNNMGEMGYAKLIHPGHLKKSRLVGYLAVVRSRI